MWLFQRALAISSGVLMVDVSADLGFVTAIMTAVTCPMNRTVVSSIWYLLSFSVGGKPMDRLHVAILMTFLDIVTVYLIGNWTDLDKTWQRPEKSDLVNFLA